MKRTILALAFSICAIAHAVEVSNVSAKQRWPWNNLVDVDFTVASDVPGEVYMVALDATCAGGAKTFSATTFASDPIVSSGTNRVTWDFGADFPNVRADDMQITVSLVPFSDTSVTPIYMKIDLSGGPNATRYPVSYSFTGPAHVKGATGEPCQTTELWLRRIRHPANVLVYHNWQYSGEDAYYGRQTYDYYIGVFETTQRQYELVMGRNPSYFTNKTCYASRPVEDFIARIHLFGTGVDNGEGSNMNIQKTPENLNANSFFGRKRARTGLPFVLPSSMQVEWAARGGAYGGEYSVYKVGGVELPLSAVARYTGNSGFVSGVTPARDADLTTGTAAVGSYDPNEFGLYDMLGNVYELTCEYVKSAGTVEREMRSDLVALRTAAGDNTIGKSAANPVVDWCGQDTAGNCYRIMCGAFNSSAPSLWLFTAQESATWNENAMYKTGFRISMNVR